MPALEWARSHRETLEAQVNFVLFVITVLYQIGCLEFLSLLLLYFF